MATVTPAVRAERMAKLRAKAVLPIEGRAAMMIRSEGCSPAVSWSRRRYPVATPVVTFLLLYRAVSSSNTVRTRSLLLAKVLLLARSEMEKMDFSDSSRRTGTSLVES